MSSLFSKLRSFAFFGCKTKIETHTPLARALQVSSQYMETFVSGVSLRGRQIKITQHYFEEPVLQPRSGIITRREADLTGLKGRL